MSVRRSRLILPFAIVIAILAVSTSSIFVRYAQLEAPSIVIAALRLGFAVVAIAPFAITRYRSELRALTRHELLLAVLSGGFLAIHFAAWITSLEYTSIVSSVVLVSTAPLWVALFSPLFLKEALTRPILIGMLLALLGGSVIALGDSCQIDHGLVCPSFSGFLRAETMFGNFLALVGACHSLTATAIPAPRLITFISWITQPAFVSRLSMSSLAFCSGVI